MTGLMFSYTGPRRLRPGTPGPVQELVKIGDFEAQLDWAIGLDRRRPVQVTRDGTTVTLTVRLLTRTGRPPGRPVRPDPFTRSYFSQGARKLSISRQPRGRSSRARTTLSSTTTSVGIVSTANRSTRSGRSFSSTR